LVPGILLVEDDLDVRLLIEHVLIDAGHQVDATGTVQGGCDLLRCRGYDLVIADGKLPDGTGMDIADVAREKAVKALIITGYAFLLPRSVQERYEIFAKPLRPREIVQVVERALRSLGPFSNA